MTVEVACRIRFPVIRPCAACDRNDSWIQILFLKLHSMVQPTVKHLIEYLNSLMVNAVCEQETRFFSTEWYSEASFLFASPFLSVIPIWPSHIFSLSTHLHNKLFFLNVCKHWLREGCINNILSDELKIYVGSFLAMFFRQKIILLNLIKHFHLNWINIIYQFIHPNLTRLINLKLESKTLKHVSFVIDLSSLKVRYVSQRLERQDLNWCWTRWGWLNKQDLNGPKILPLFYLSATRYCMYRITDHPKTNNDCRFMFNM